MTTVLDAPRVDDSPEPEQPQLLDLELTDPRKVGIQVEAKLQQWNVPYEYDPAVPVDSIKFVESAQVRREEAGAYKEQVEEYAEQMRNGAVFPPIVLLGNNILTDGNTRIKAHKKLRRTTIPAFKTQFPNPDLAVAFAGAMNQRNGRRLRKEDAHRAAISLLDAKHSEESVAAELGYSRTQIANWRRETSFWRKAEATALPEEVVAKIKAPTQRKLSGIGHNPQFAAATTLVANKPGLTPKQVSELVEAVESAEDDADALAAVDAKNREWATIGNPPVVAHLPEEIRVARRTLPQLLKMIDRPVALVEHDPERREAWAQQWRALEVLAHQVVELHDGA